MVNDWNRLGRHVVSAETIDSFKKTLDECVGWISTGERRDCLV